MWPSPPGFGFKGSGVTQMTRSLRKRRKGFSLVELLVVTVILAVLVAIVLPTFGVTESEAHETVRDKEMNDLRQAFAAMEADCMLSNLQLNSVVNCGLWPVFQREDPESALPDLTVDIYDPARGRGWRGAYAGAEGTRPIDPDATNAPGQSLLDPSDSDSVVVPVALNPWGNHYRVLCPRKADGTTNKLNRMALVCPGSDGALDTLRPTDSDAENDVVAAGDDYVILLRPLSK